MTTLGILLSLALLTYVAYRGYSVIVFAPLCAIVAVLFNPEMHVLPLYTEVFMAKGMLFAKAYFPLFLLGIWWSGSNKQGAIAGLIVGGLISVIAITYFIAGKAGSTLPAHEFVSYWLGAWYFALIGAPLAIIVHIVVSKLTKETPVEIRKFLIEKVHS